MLNEAMQRRCGQHNAQIEIKDIARQTIADQVEAFLAKGGVVQKMDIRINSDVASGEWHNTPAIEDELKFDHSTDLAAKFLGISPRRLDTLRHKGLGPKFIIKRFKAGNGQKVLYRYTMADLVAYKRDVMSQNKELEL